jgi:hypothetical protein
MAEGLTSLMTVKRLCEGKTLGDSGTAVLQWLGSHKAYVEWQPGTGGSGTTPAECHPIFPVRSETEGTHPKRCRS